MIRVDYLLYRCEHLSMDPEDPCDSWVGRTHRTLVPVGSGNHVEQVMNFRFSERHCLRT